MVIDNTSLFEIDSCYSTKPRLKWSSNSGPLSWGLFESNNWIINVLMKKILRCDSEPTCWLGQSRIPFLHPLPCVSRRCLTTHIHLLLVMSPKRGWHRQTGADFLWLVSVLLARWQPQLSWFGSEIQLVSIPRGSNGERANIFSKDVCHMSTASTFGCLASRATRR